MSNNDDHINSRVAVERALLQEQFFRWLVVRLGIASVIALAGWSVYLCIIIKRLLH